MRIAVCISILCALAGGAAAGGGAAQDERPIFRVETRLVEVDAHVTDRSGEFVEGLTADDFEILENGVPQEVMLLSVVNLPVDRRGRPELVAVGDDNPGGAGDLSGTPPVDPLANFDDVGRLYVMILDSGPHERVRRLARLFVEEFMGATDVMAVVHTRSRAEAQGLTGDRAALLAAIDRYPGGAGSDEESFRLLKEVAVNLNAVAGRRKGILFIGTGSTLLWPRPLLTEPDGALQRRREAWRLLNDALQTAARNNVRIHPIDPGGFTTGRVENLTTESNPFIEDGIRRLEALEIRSYAFDGQSSLRLMAEDTGGHAIVNTNNFAGNFARVVRDHSAYYVLGYYSSAPRDGEFQQITVRVRQPGLRVRARSGYRTPLPDVPGPAVSLPRGLSAAARTALRGTPAAPAAVQVGLATTVFPGDGFQGSVLVETRLAGGDLSWSAGERLELAYVAVDQWDRIRAAGREMFMLRPTEESRARLMDADVRLAARLTVPAGRYEIRVAAHQPGGRTGLATTQVEVPHFDEQTLSISDLVLASAEADLVLTLLDDERVRRALAAAPTTRRRFTPGETLRVFGEIRDSHWLLASELRVTSTISRDRLVVLRDEQTLRAGDNGAFFYTGTVPLAPLGPGTYTLAVEAHTVEGIPAAASTQLQFEVATEPIRATATASAPGPPERFEFSATRRSGGSLRDGGALRVLPGGRMEARGVQLIGLVRVAYGFDTRDPRLVSGGPAWLYDDRYDIVAGSTGEWSTRPRPGEYPPELPPLLRDLLEDRFGLSTRIDERRMRVYAIERTDGPLGPSLQRSAGTCHRAASVDAAVPSQPDPMAEPCRVATTLGSVRMQGQTMADLARALSRFPGIGEFVVDRTGLEGIWDLEVIFDPDPREGTIFAAFEEQLGLRLVRTEAPVEHLVVERARRPAED